MHPHAPSTYLHHTRTLYIHAPHTHPLHTCTTHAPSTYMHHTRTLYIHAAHRYPLHTCTTHAPFRLLVSNNTCWTQASSWIIVYAWWQCVEGRGLNGATCIYSFLIFPSLISLAGFLAGIQTFQSLSPEARRSSRCRRQSLHTSDFSSCQLEKSLVAREIALR